jgi:hypothetical protein
MPHTLSRTSPQEELSKALDQPASACSNLDNFPVIPPRETLSRKFQAPQPFAAIWCLTPWRAFVPGSSQDKSILEVLKC